MPDTTSEDNKLHGLSPAARNEGPDSHKDNSKHMGKVHTGAANNSDEKNKEDKENKKSEGDTGENNEGNA